MEICIVYFVLDNIKVDVGRKLTCAVHAAYWVQLENIVSISLWLQQMWLTYRVEDWVERRG